jgi:hypothetical protein
VFLVVVVAKERARRDAGGFGDFGDGGRLDSLSFEEGDRGLVNFAARLRATAFGERWCVVGHGGHFVTLPSRRPA